MLGKHSDLAKMMNAATANGGNKGAIERAILKIKRRLEKSKSDYDSAELNFYISNGYYDLRFIEREAYQWIWDGKNIGRQIYYLRVARKALLKIPLEERTDLRCRVLTSLGEALNYVGRCVEAVDLYDEALKINPDFSMAMANKGSALLHYARYMSETYNYQPCFFYLAQKNYKQALAIGVESHATDGVKKKLKEILAIYDYENFYIKHQKESRGKTTREKKYRTWCLNNRLFINPLNDLGEWDIAARDVLTLPKENDIIPDKIHEIYSQLMQEYVSARYVLFEVIEDSENIHFSDDRIDFYLGENFRYYGLWVEKKKMAFMSAYAIFDKISYLINEYWKLELDTNRINFHSVWREKNGKNLLSEFSSSSNWPLRGLFRVSQDLYYKNTTEQPNEPEAKDLYYIRNHIAHKYLKVYEHTIIDTATCREEKGHDEIYSISDIELREQTIKLLKLVRSSLMYTSFAIQHKAMIEKTA